MPARPIHGTAIALLALTVYLLFGQKTIYGDGFQFVMWVSAGQPRHPVHFLFLPLLNLVDRTVGDVFGFYQSARFLCALGTAVGVWFVHAACRRMDLERDDAALVAALVAATPSMFFFATVLEIHGVFFAFVGIAFRIAAGVARAPGALRAAALGASTTVAYLIHASAAAMIMPLGLWVFVELRRRGLGFAQAAKPIVVAAVAHSALIAAAYVAVPRLLGIRGQSAVGFWNDHVWFPLSQVALPTLYYEWIAAFAPLSVAFVAGFFRPALRGHASALALTLLPYWACSIWLIPAGWTSPPGNERGAYLMPLVLPAAWIVVRALPRPAHWALLALALAASVATVLSHENTAPTERFAAGVLAHSGDRAVLLLAASQDGMQACMSFLPHAEMYWLPDLFAVHPDAQQGLADALERTLGAAADDGRAVLVSKSGMQLAEQLRDVLPGARTFLAFLAERCDVVPVATDGFDGVELRLRGR